jgi:hypothetical protein
MKSGDEIKTLAGTTVTLPLLYEHPCFGQRQGWCQNTATWRFESEHLLLHWCDQCKPRHIVQGLWTQLQVRGGVPCGVTGLG